VTAATTAAACTPAWVMNDLPQDLLAAKLLAVNCRMKTYREGSLRNQIKIITGTYGWIGHPRE
jgi:hypothetical protein